MIYKESAIGRSSNPIMVTSSGAGRFMTACACIRLESHQTVFWRQSESGSGLKNTKKCWLYWSVYLWTEADAVPPRACTGEQNGFFNHIIAIQADKAKKRIQFSGASAKKKISDDGSSVVRYKAFDWRNSPGLSGMRIKAIFSGNLRNVTEWHRTNTEKKT